MKLWIVGILLALSMQPSRSSAEVLVEDRQGVRIDGKAYSFSDEAGRKVRIQEYLDQGLPVLLNFVYFECPGACTVLLNQVVRGLTPHILVPGRDFLWLVVSLSPQDTPELAIKKKATYLKVYGRTDVASGWHFLTGPGDDVDRLADRLGFRFERDLKTGRIEHPAAVFILSPEGTLSGMMGGFEFPGGILRANLLRSAKGGRGTFTGSLSAICYQYLPHVGWLDRPERWLGFLLALTASLFGLYLSLKRFQKKIDPR